MPLLRTHSFTLLCLLLELESESDSLLISDELLDDDNVGVIDFLLQHLPHFLEICRSIIFDFEGFFLHRPCLVAPLLFESELYG